MTYEEIIWYHREGTRRLILYSVIAGLLVSLLIILFWYITGCLETEEYVYAPISEVDTVDVVEIPYEEEIENANDYYLSECPLSVDLQKVIFETCNKYDIPYNFAFALIEVESNFNLYAVNKTSGCYGLCQLHPQYFPNDLSPADNIRVGIGYLAELYLRGGDMVKALTIYNVGHDNGSRWYANKVLKTAEKWDEIFCNNF